MSKQNGTPRPAPGGFDALGLHPDLLQAVADMGFVEPTPIQAEAVPPALEGRDVLGCAMTGSGKTAAFLLPLLQRLREKGRGRTRALVLTPTRELAAQVLDHLEALARHTGVTGTAVFGGVSAGPQEEALRRGVDVVVATPGRLLDHLQQPYARLDGVEVLVLDEADRMLDMGFLADIRRVLSHLGDGRRQTLFFSATMPRAIVRLSDELLRDPARIGQERKQAPARGITQTLFPVPGPLKPYLLMELLRRDEVGNVIVFCRTKHRTNRLAEKLEKNGFAVARIHGNRSQKQRTKALEGFKDGTFRVLAATDVVARGIDVEALDHVVNFDVPAAPEDYVHRVGRTARAEATGEAYTLFSPEEEDEVRGIEKALGKRIERRRLEGFDYDARPTERFEVPLEERIAKMREERRRGRERAAAKKARREERERQGGGGGGSSDKAGESSGRGRKGDGSSGGSSSRSRRRRGGRGRGRGGRR